MQAYRKDTVARGADAFIANLQKPNDGYAFLSAGIVLPVLAQKLSPEQITRAVESLIFVLETWPNELFMRAAGDGLVALAPKLSPEQIADVWDLLIAGLHKSNDSAVSASAGVVLVALAPRLSPEQITIGWHAFITVLQKPNDGAAFHAAASVLVAFAPRLSPAQITEAVDALIPVLEKTTDIYAQQAAGNVLVALAAMLSPESRMRTAEAMVSSLHRVTRGYITEQLLAFMPHLERPTQDRIASETITTLLDYLAASESYFVSDGVHLSVFSPGIQAMTTERSMATLLQHPASTGEPREWMLQRFEELVFHDGNRVFLNLPDEDGERRGNFENSPSAIPVAGANEHGGLTPNRSPAEPPPRRFHTVHDAAAWIQQNWPDFDLEATHPVTWRGEM